MRSLSKELSEKKKKLKHDRLTCLCEKSYLLSQSDNKKVQRQIQNRSLKKVKKLNICYQKQTSLENLSLKKKQIYILHPFTLKIYLFN